MGDEKQTIGKAFKRNLIPKIGKREYRANIKKIAEIDSEIKEIRDNLNKHAVNIAEIVNREVSDIKIRKDSLLRERSKISLKLDRVRSDLAENKYIRSKTFETLIDYFPAVDKGRISQVEEFHSKITKILKGELKESEGEYSQILERIDAAISEVDIELSTVLANVERPDIIVDRVYELSNVRSGAAAEIKYFEDSGQVDKDFKQAKADLVAEKARVLEFVQSVVNNKTRYYVNKIYSEERRSPVLEMSQNSYTFKAVEDTGTGKAYSNLVLFDFAVFDTTALPFVIHDSFLFKNIETEAVAKMIGLYLSFDKQTFIAMDEVHKYGEEAEAQIQSNRVIQLTNESVLYIKDWRK